MTTTVDAATAHVTYESTIRVDRSAAEGPLLFLTAVAALAIWVVAAVTIFGLIYAALIGVFFFLGHVMFVTHVRGNGVRVGPDQFPEIDAAVKSLARRMELFPAPQVYVMQAGGSLNAFAAKFLRSNLVVLFSDLLDACGSDTAARDMIIAHELGHIRAGHLRWTWFLLPGTLVPFLGTALSRAREYTCDAIGAQGAGNRASAILGLTILAAGPHHGRRVNLGAMVRQRADLNTGWMRIGEWFSTHPPLARRIAAIDPMLDPSPASDAAGTARALLIVGAAVAMPVVAVFVAVTAFMGLAAQLASQQAGLNPAALERESDPAEPVAFRPEAPTADAAAQPAPEAGSIGLELTLIQAQTDLQAFADEIQRELEGSGQAPADVEALYQLMKRRHPDLPEPMDPFGGQRYGYDRTAEGWTLRAAGPDKQLRTVDDVVKRGVI